MSVVSMGRISGVIGLAVMVSVDMVTVMLSAGVGACVGSDGFWSCVGAMCMSSWPAPIITISSMMLKINRFIVMCGYSRPLSAYEKYLFWVMITWSRT